MPSLISATERAILTGIFNDIFDTFQRPIVVFKEPIKTLIPPNPNNFVYGFGDSQAADTYSYTQVSGVYPARIKYDDQTIDINSDTKAFASAGNLTIKVKQDCRDFISNGKTEKFLVDGRTFILDSDERKSTFLDSEFYIFELKATK